MNRETARALRDLGTDYRSSAWLAVGELDPEDPAPEVRAEIGRLHTRADGMEAAASRLEDCGRAWTQHECERSGHIAHTPLSCGRPALCPHCARMESARLQRIYSGRIAAALLHSPYGVRLRRVVLSLRRGDLEGDEDAFVRCVGAAKTVYRLLWGVPRSKAEWGMYFALFPLTQTEIEKAGSERAAKARRRERVRRFAKPHGCLVDFERAEGEGMNPHVHLTVVGRYVKQCDLSAAWLLATGDSTYADIRAHKDACDIAEGLKYVTKFTARTPEELVRIFDSMLIESGDRVRCRRRVEALGVLRGKVAGENDIPPLLCDRCGSVMHAVGIINPGLWEMGVREIPEEDRFRSRSPP